MADDTRVSGSVSVDSDSRQRVAYDLAVRIASDEKPGTGDRESRTREYWFKLYRQCLQLTSHASVKNALEAD